MRAYVALIHKEEASDFGVSFPDVPGCITAGRTLDEARDLASEALALHLSGLADDGDPLPEPSSLESVMSDRDNLGGVAILVDAEGRDVTLPRDLVDLVDSCAERHGMTRSSFLVQAAKREIERAS